MKKIKFNQELESLIDENGIKYNGKRFNIINVVSICPSSSKKSAINTATVDLENKALELKANAYEIINIRIFDSKQEYDSTPFTASLSAVLYKNR
jgi:hypothetical protein